MGIFSLVSGVLSRLIRKYSRKMIGGMQHSLFENAGVGEMVLGLSIILKEAAIGYLFER
jgi:hypothetical protein